MKPIPELLIELRAQGGEAPAVAFQSVGSANVRRGNCQAQK